METVPEWGKRKGQRAMIFSCLVFLFIYLGQVRCQKNCPWNQPNLKYWSDGSIWADGHVPKDGSKVIIPSEMKVVLDVSVNLKALVIDSNAELIWKNEPNLVMETGYIHVKGAFHMGSKTCRLREPATIRLTGRSNGDTYISSDNDELRKVILVEEGGTLELHGRKKTPWTKLAQSIPRLADIPCAHVYNHSDYETNFFAVDRSYGLHVMVWNPDGSVFDYIVLQVYKPLRDFIAAIPHGKIIAMHAFAKHGLHDRRNKKLDFATLDEVITGVLGGSNVTLVTKSDSYSLLTVKGHPELTQEYYKRKGRIDVDLLEEFLEFPVWETGLSFQVAISARTIQQYFRVIQLSAAMPILELADEVTDWNPGDLIVVASTDFDWKQAEVRKIIECEECSPSQIRVNATFRFRHYGNFTYHVDERAEVGLLTRNILIEGVMEDECYANNGMEKKLCERFGHDTFGGHIKFLRHFTSVHVQGVELYHMGQQVNLGSYPLHYHMCDEGPGSWLRDNSIHHTFSRCITIHGTDKVEISGNVCYDHLGHGYFLEDSVEQENVIRNNLGLGTRFGTLLMSDSTKEWCKKDYTKGAWAVNCAEVSTFWITHPNNYVSHNSAAGGDCHGFMYVFGDVPLGPSYDRQLELGKVGKYHAKSYPITEFYNNVAHSNERSGVFLDSYISSGGRVDRDEDVPENGIVQEENEYEPKFPYGDYNGTRIWTKMERVTAYKNKQNNMWVKGGNLNVTFSSLADAASQSFSGGCTGFWTGTSLEYSVVIARTDNLGEPRLWNEELDNKEVLSLQFNGSIGKSPWSTLQGVALYQGPMFVKHSYFDRFATSYWQDKWKGKLGKRPVSHAGAISFKKDSTYPTYTSQYTTNLTFGYCDNVNNGHYLYFGTADTYDWENTCGPRNAINRDVDGSLTGTPNTFIVRDRKFNTGPECLPRPDWGMSVCPYRYIKVEVKGDDGSLSSQLHDKYPLVARRDDARTDLFVQKAQQRMEYLMRTHKSYLVSLNTSLPGAMFPSEIRVYGYGVEIGDVVRLGICVPLDLTDLEIESDYPVKYIRNNHTMVNRLRDVDEDPTHRAIFHDKKNGIIFFKVYSLDSRTNDTQLCPAGNCYKLKIKLNNGDRTKVRDCLDIKVPSYKDTRPPPDPVTMKSCKIGSPQGLGAIRWEEVPKIVHEDFTVPCFEAPQPQRYPGSTEPQHQGCFLAETQAFSLTQVHRRTMTVDWCILRCYQYGYEYAGLSAASVCSCSHVLLDNDAARDVGNRKCIKRCTGTPKNKEKTCGHGGRMDIWSTGLPVNR